MIYQFSPFYNENLIVNVAANESMKYNGTIYITESNRDFHYRKKGINYSQQNSNVIHRFINVDGKFVPNNIWGKISLIRYRFSQNRYESILKSPTWYNESIQRNSSASIDRLDFKDDDVIILCDIDEILDSRKIDLVLDAVKKHGIVTGKLHFTMFFFNLFSLNWGGAKDYSYRLFAMTAEHFLKLVYSSDELRKKGESGELIDKIHMIDDFIGFHHSWVGDADFVENKIKAYAHVKEHKGLDGIEYIKRCLKEHTSIFPGHNLELREDILLLDSVEEVRNNKEYKPFFI